LLTFWDWSAESEWWIAPSRRSPQEELERATLGALDASAWNELVKGPMQLHLLLPGLTDEDAGQSIRHDCDPQSSRRTEKSDAAASAAERSDSTGHQFHRIMVTAYTAGTGRRPAEYGPDRNQHAYDRRNDCR